MTAGNEYRQPNKSSSAGSAVMRWQQPHRFLSPRALEECTGFDIVKIAVDRDGGRHEWMCANAPHIGHDARMDISDRQPVDELASVRAWLRAPIVPALRVNPCLLQALRQQVANNLIRKVPMPQSV